jgi:hypothetical protein
MSSRASKKTNHLHFREGWTFALCSVNSFLLFVKERRAKFAHNRSLSKSKEQNLLTIALFQRTKSKICSQLIFAKEKISKFAHDGSLSKSKQQILLTIALCQRAKERNMSELLKNELIAPALCSFNQEKY